MFIRYDAQVRTPSRPRILITRAEEVLGEHWDDYAACIQRAGGDPTPVDLATGIEPYPAFDGLIVTAGVDIDPARYGAEPGEYIRETNPARDTFEESLLAEARRRDLPIFAICRGHQLLNTSRGGSLLQHLDEREPHRARRSQDGESIASGWHDIEVTSGSLLRSIVGTNTIHANSRHHQAVLTSAVAPGLRVTGTAAQDVVEALEDPAMTWCLSVQWHPERPEMTDAPEMQNSSTALFEAFVAACTERVANAASIERGATR
jgi:putative glutamine amidotransferase